ncbi:hypothetical protein BKA70DRAFT_1429208 [Coprinopsis sp. MPI-PUGE-AT-0042]|nr:hypothetical protein BKA70DRAFT_1429208 [Coprinopsis sp. MPI-PUGE-AT-0042]
MKITAPFVLQMLAVAAKASADWAVEEREFDDFGFEVDAREFDNIDLGVDVRHSQESSNLLTRQLDETLDLRACKLRGNCANCKAFGAFCEYQEGVGCYMRGPTGFDGQCGGCECTRPVLGDITNNYNKQRDGKGTGGIKGGKKANGGLAKHPSGKKGTKRG